MSNPASLSDLLARLGELKSLLDQAHARETASWEATCRGRVASPESAASVVIVDAAWKLPNSPDDILPPTKATAAVTVGDSPPTATAAGDDSVGIEDAGNIRQAVTVPATERPPSREQPSLQTLQFPKSSMTAPRTSSMTGFFPKSLKQIVQMQIDAKKAGSFVLREAWDMRDDEIEKFRYRASVRNGSGKSNLPSQSKIRTSRSRRQHEALMCGKETEQSRCVVRPTSTMRLSWDVSACLLLCLDLVLVPLGAFDLGRNPFLVFTEVLSVIFWALDIGASFATGIYVGRDLELRAAKIARAYIRSWFGFDIIVVGSELVMFIFEAAAATTNLARTVRTARFLRVVRYLRVMRLLRLLRFKHVIDDLKDRTNHEFLLMAISVSKLVALIGVLIHALACLWYFIGDVPPEQEGAAMGWVWVPNDEGVRLVDNNLGERYLYSFQFSLARLHPSNMSDNMELQTLRERFFSIFATVCAMVIVSIFVSHLTNRMAEVKKMRAQLTQKTTLIRNYSQKHHISAPLVATLKKYIVTIYAAKIREGDEKKLMEVLPHYLLADLRHETFSPSIDKHGLFATMMTKHKRTAMDVCYRSLEEVNVFHGETIFTTGDVCTRMLFVASRPLYYELGYADTVVETEPRPTDDLAANHDDDFAVLPGEWISEAALWTEWENCGELRAVETCAVVAVDADAFGETLRDHTTALVVDVVPYARQFIKDLNSTGQELTDLATEAYPSRAVRPSSSSLLRMVSH